MVKSVTFLDQEIWENLRLSRKKVDHKVSDRKTSAGVDQWSGHVMGPAIRASRSAGCCLV